METLLKRFKYGDVGSRQYDLCCGAANK
ncbi:hypothetical protein CCACVL1_09941 [Corchorus capsularis]|uniref:Uncharacterized protein n=1 Tax=Corchorus capsularis TaxID=210143 RepID=A0A1R3ITH7_COCAP|nr:hypothetical protein CCACVL1_09941 [Corchorus capsularis]